MRVVVKIHGSSEYRFLVDLQNQKLIKEINSLINRKKYSKAAATALTKGEVLEEIPEQVLLQMKADLILTENHAYRSLA